MSYKNAEMVLPAELVELIQSYIDGEYLYIPRKEERRKPWGADTPTKVELKNRNDKIHRDYLAGMSVKELAAAYFLSEKSIQRVVRDLKVN